VCVRLCTLLVVYNICNGFCELYHLLFSSYFLGLVSVCAVVIRGNLEHSFSHILDNVVSFVIQVALVPPVISAKMCIGIVGKC
jgi:hypothetical protein